MKITRVTVVAIAAVASAVGLAATQAAAVSTEPSARPAAAAAWQNPVVDMAGNPDGNVAEGKKKPKRMKVDPKAVSLNDGTQEVN